MLDFQRKKSFLYMLFAIAAVLITLLGFLSTYFLTNTYDESSQIIELKNNIVTLNESYSVELLNQKILTEDLNTYLEFYVQAHDEFDSLVNNSLGNQNNVVQDLQDELAYTETQNAALKEQLALLEAQLK